MHLVRLVAVDRSIACAQTTAITDAGLVLGTVTQQSSATVATGSVISPNPGAHTSVALGSAASLVVGSGPAPVSVLATPVINPETELAKTITLSWSNVANESGYDIGFENCNTRRRACGDLGILRKVGTDVTVRTDTRNGGGAYCYAVRAHESASASNWSNVVQVAVPKKLGNGVFSRGLMAEPMSLVIA